MPDIQGNSIIRLRPGDELTYEFAASPCSSRTANDGSIPYGTTVSSVLVKAYDKTGADKTSEIVSQSSVGSNIVGVVLTYPATNGPGKYQLRFALTLDNSEVVNKRFDNLYAIGDDS